MSRDPASDEPSALADWLAVPAPGISLLSFRSQITFVQVLEDVFEYLPHRHFHIVGYDPENPDSPAGMVAQMMVKCRELADDGIPAIFLRPVTGLMDAEEATNAVAFWKNLNHLRERIGDLPAQIVLCVDDIQKPYAYGYAKDLIAWCSPRFLFPQLSPPPGWKVEQSPAKSGESADYAAASLFWRSLHPRWATLISSGEAITADHVRHILLPLMDAALGMGLVTQADIIYQQAAVDWMEINDEDVQLDWLNTVGQLESLKGDLPAAAKSYAAAMEIARALVARDPENTEWQQDLSISHDRLGNIAVAQGDLPAAAKAYTAALEITQALAARDPENTEWRRDLFVSHIKLGDIAVAQGDLPAAAKAYTAGLEIRQALADRDPQNTQWQRDLSVSHSKLGDIAKAQDDLPAAAKAYTAALEIAQALAARDPQNTQWQRDLSVSHSKLGDIAVAQGDLPAAAKAYTAGLEIARALAARDPQNTEWQRDLSVSHNKLGNIAVAQGDLPAAAKAYTAALEIAQALAARDPENTEWQRDLSVSHNKLGDIAVAQGDLPAAAKAYTAGLEIAQALAARDPENTQWQRDLSVSHYRLAIVAEKAGDAAEARAQYRKSHDVLQAIAAKGKHVSPHDMEWLAMLKEKAGIE